MMSFILIAAGPPCGFGHRVQSSVLGNTQAEEDNMHRLKKVSLAEKKSDKRQVIARTDRWSNDLALLKTLVAMC